MTALLLLGLVPLVMWLGQTVMLRLHHLPIRWRLDAAHAPRSVRTAGRVVTNAALLLLILSYPLLQHRAPLEYYRALFPVRLAAAHFGFGFAAAVVYLGMLFLMCVAA